MCILNVDHGLFNPSKIYTDAPTNVNFAVAHESATNSPVQSVAGDAPVHNVPSPDIMTRTDSLDTLSINVGSKLPGENVVSTSFPAEGKSTLESRINVVSESVPTCSKTSDVLDFVRTPGLAAIPNTTIPGGSKSAIANSPLRTSTPLRGNQCRF